MKNPTDNPPFSYLVKVGNVSANPVDIHLEADKDELQALAENLGRDLGRRFPRRSADRMMEEGWHPRGRAGCGQASCRAAL